MGDRRGDAVNGSPARRFARKLLGEVPLALEALAWLSNRAAPPASGFRLERLEEHLVRWCSATRQVRAEATIESRKDVLVLGLLPWWIEYSLAVSLLLAAGGHRIRLIYLPYRNWRDPADSFDLRRQRLYLRRLLSATAGCLETADLSAVRAAPLPPDLEESIEALSRIDVQYTLQHELLDLTPGTPDEQLYRLRLERNRAVAGAIQSRLGKWRPDVIIVPNGSILEFGAVYRTGRHAGISTVTFEFGEQRERMWVAQNDEAMRLITSDLWNARGDVPIGQKEIDSLREIYLARRGARLWENFGRKWQAAEGQGAQAVRRRLNLDPRRPVALLCTNVVGDSLALDRQVFSKGMADWLARTVQYFEAHTEAQLVVRVHPGELLGAGHPSTEIVRQATLEMPSTVRVVPPDSDINTYDLIEIAHLGLVYTTTVGMEMVMQGVPVIVCGATHYRGKGFTHDPASWEAYIELLDKLLGEPLGRRAADEQTELAMRYAYRFFFEYPFPFPWNVIGFWRDMEARPFEDVVRDMRDSPYAQTMDALLGRPIDWSRKAEKSARSVIAVER